MKKYLLGVTGGIAAYKAVELCRRLIESGHQVRVVMTRSATEFVAPLTFQAVSGFPVHRELFDEAAEAAMGHIELAKWADQIIVAPATASFCARLAQGLADDLLTTICLATAAPIAIAPAMNQQMWAAQATQSNLDILMSRNIQIIGPGKGAQACGDIGLGRLLEPAQIIDHLKTPCTTLLQGQSWLITAGPTREQIDPVRFLSNNSSGKMGFAIAKMAARFGAKVTLVSGPVNLETPERVSRVNACSAEEMHQAVKNSVVDSDVFVSCAAVADYRPATTAEHKIKKNSEQLDLSLIKNIDILQYVGALAKKPFCVGFAAETQNLEENAKGKLQRKNLDMICANNVGDKQIGFDSDQNQLTLFYRDGTTYSIPMADKTDIAIQLVERIHQAFTNT
ncbi:MAG: bifunctional phosphopantothenoylcysteine decarboxylase/phosphopantothenate--cysteine ligase CoaBC [Gammaproteobacteria bacterium]|nr:bifunctional phosphopantothenoylcysteine decarboxylase/phosphopantothenate--cysteine ligase CoaBC [Gammaproteobacteria bacterium]